MGIARLLSGILLMSAAPCAYSQATLGAPVAPGAPQPPLHFPQLVAEQAPPLRLPAPPRPDLARTIADGTYSPAEITAARIKMDEFNALARCEAVRYLTTVDCHYYPEAELSLIAALRTDRIECVRYETALAIGTMRRATPRLIEALTYASQGSGADGNPVEMSERVRAAAHDTLGQIMAGPARTTPVVAEPASIFQAPSLYHFLVRLRASRNKLPASQTPSSARRAP